MAANQALDLLDRASEREAIDRLLASVRQGQSAVLVIRGDAGIGKTALLRYAAAQASEFRVAQVAAVEAEMELPFAAVHQLCSPMLARLDDLPEPQRKALSVAFGLSFGTAPDRFLIALAVLNLLSVVADERPFLCLVDDAQWLDRASDQVFGFVARRMLAESVGMLFAVRDTGNKREFLGLPELSLGALADEDARALLARAVPGRLDVRVRDRLVAETGGNPLALLELTRRRSPAELAGGFEVPGAEDLPAHIEEHYVRRIGALPSPTRQLLLLAAADPVGDATLVWRAASRLGITFSDLAAATDADLLEIGVRVRFRHPLVRSAVYRTAVPSDRRAVHEALAEVSDPELDGDRRAWHRALAAPGPDEDVAAQLERSAARAQTRGGIAAGAAFLERAAALTPAPAHRARRALAAAQARHQAGAPEAALALLATAQAGPLDPRQQAEAELLQAEIAFTSNRGRDAPALLLDAAKKLERFDVTLARETYLEAFMAAQFAGRFASVAALDVAAAARAAPASTTPRAPDLLLDGLAAMIIEGHAAAAPLLKRALEAFRTGDVSANGGFRWLWLAEAAAIELWDYDSWHEFAVREMQMVRDAGALTMLPFALSANIVARIFAGELAGASSLVDEVRIVSEATQSHFSPFGTIILAAWRGQEAEFSGVVEATLKECVLRGEGIGVSCCQWAGALLYNGLAQYETALDWAQQLLGPPRLDADLNWALPELVEAATRCGRTQLADDALAQLSEMTRAGGTDWALGLEARSRALLSQNHAAEHLYREAIERLGRSRQRAEHARAHLLYGEWLRREGRRRDARDQLRTAHQMFLDVGAEAFAERARGELLATGQKVRKRQVETRLELTAQERQIARLARDGLSNSEIGARLFVSPRTVEWHLRKVFTKLGIQSRRELANALRDSDSRLVSA